MMSFIQNLDLEVLELIYNNLHNPFMDTLMVIVTTLGDSGYIWILIAFILIATKKYRKVGLLVLSALLLNLILVNGVLKNLIQRPRPFQMMSVHLLIPEPGSFSFPSGHTSASFAAAGILVGLLKKYKVYVIILAIAIAFSRMYLFVHYPSDIIGGMVMGLLCAKITLSLYELISAKVIMIQGKN